MTPDEIALQWDRVMEHEAFKAQVKTNFCCFVVLIFSKKGAAVLSEHISTCFERGILE
jgi:hypothetical protein